MKSEHAFARPFFVSDATIMPSGSLALMMRMIACRGRESSSAMGAVVATAASSAALFRFLLTFSGSAEGPASATKRCGSSSMSWRLRKFGPPLR